MMMRGRKSPSIRNRASTVPRSQSSRRSRRRRRRTMPTGLRAPPPNGWLILNSCAGSTMAMQLPSDFKEFLRLLGRHGVRYLLIGGYAVNYYGYPRATGDIDVWIALDLDNATRMVDVLREFGFGTPELSTDLFLQEGRMVRM